MDLHSDIWVNNWQNIKNAGIEIVINKATEGTYYTDRYLTYRYNECKKLGLLFGVYHFAGNGNITAEVKAFINYIKGMSFDALHWLDIEDVQAYSWKWTKTTAVNFVNQFTKLFKQLTGEEIGIYCNQSFYESYLKGNIDSNLKLWIAHYGINNIPYANQSWQYTDKGVITNESSKFDLDLFQDNIVLKTQGDDIVDSIVIYKYGPDMHSAEILADYLNSPTISSTRIFDYSKVKTIYAVGGSTGDYTSHLTKLISGADRYSTAQAVLDFIKNGGK